MPPKSAKRKHQEEEGVSEQLKDIRGKMEKLRKFLPEGVAASKQTGKFIYI